MSAFDSWTQNQEAQDLIRSTNVSTSASSLVSSSEEASSLVSSSEEAKPEITDAVFVDKGYFFFDYEKALTRTSNISQIFDVRKIEQFFGRSLTNNLFRMAAVMVDLNHIVAYDPDDELAGDGNYQYLQVQEDGNSIIKGLFEPIIQIVGIHNEEDPSHHAEVVSSYISYDTADDTYHSHFSRKGHTGQYNCVLSRSFNTASPEGMLNDDGDLYRILCYEFQKLKIVESRAEFNEYKDKALAHFYEFKVHVYDQTGQIYEILKNDLSEALSQFESYRDAAYGEGAYNNIDGYFNNFFVESFKNIYSDNLESAPYIKAPLLWAFHYDLVHNEFDGDMSRIMSEAKSWAERLSPESGTIEEIDLFYDKLLHIFEMYETADAYQGRGNPKYNYDELATYANIEGQTLHYSADPSTTRTSAYTLLNLSGYGVADQQEGASNLDTWEVEYL